MSRVTSLFWRLLPAVRGSERTRVLFFGGLYTLISAAQTVGLTGSEALLLGRLGAASLPKAFILASAVTVFGSMLYAARVGRARNDDLFVEMLLLAGAVLVSATLLTGFDGVLIGLFCFFYLTQAVFVNHFWTFSGDYFDTLTAKRLFPVFTVGASLGGLIGGLAAFGAVRVTGPLSLIIAWGLLLAGAAALLVWVRRPLRRWGPLELEEADETSVEGMAGAVHYLRGSRLGRWLVVSAVGMVVAIFIAQYLYSQVFVDRYGNEADLAAFFGLYLAVTNLIEIGLEIALVPWLIRRFGVPTAHLVHPVLTLLSLGALAVDRGMPTAIAARMNRELVENAVAQPIRTLVYNALRPRFRGRIRAFLEGIVVYAGMAAAGAALLAFDDPHPIWLCAVGAAFAVLYLAANLRARQEYLRTLVDGIRAGRLDLAELDAEIGGWEVSRLAELFRQMLAEERDRPSRSLLQLISSLGQRRVSEPLVEGLAHTSGEVRRLCVEALATAADDPKPLLGALADPESMVRLAALRAVAARKAWAGVLDDQLETLSGDGDPRIRAEAALLRVDQGTLAGMVADPERDVAIAALRVAPASLRDAILARVADADPEVRAAALERIVAVSDGPPPLSSEVLLEALEASETSVRRAAVRGLERMPRGDALAGLAGALADPIPEVRRLSIDALAGRGREGLEACLPYLRDDHEKAIEGALTVVSRCGLKEGREILARELLHRVHELWYDVIAYQRIPGDARTATTFLRVAYADAMVRNRRLCFRTLELLENQQIIRRVEKALRFGTSRSRGDALEVLSNLGDRETSRLLVLLHESGALDERADAVSSTIEVPGDADALVEASRRSEARWIRLAAEALVGALRDDPEREESMERLLALKQVPLFANLTLEQLEAVGQITREVTFLPGEVIVREGDTGGELYLLLEGAVEVWIRHGTDAAEKRADIEAIDYFGEMAILDDEPRSATIFARDRSRLLTLDGASLKELILQMPEISFEIFRMLTARVRSAERVAREE